MVGLEDLPSFNCGLGALMGLEDFPCFKCGFRRFSLFQGCAWKGLREAKSP